MIKKGIIISVSFTPLRIILPTFTFNAFHTNQAWLRKSKKTYTIPIAGQPILHIAYLCHDINLKISYENKVIHLRLAIRRMHRECTKHHLVARSGYFNVKN